MDKKMLIGKKCLSVCLAVLMLFSSLGGSMVTMAEEITEKPQTEAGLETQTEPQTAAPATEAPQVVTEAAPVTEQAITEAPAEIPMEAPTEAPTEAATQAATEPATETVNYRLLLPVYQECDYQYDALREDPETEAESQKKQRSLLYEANEKAELSILPKGGWQIKELHLYYQEGSKKEEAAYQWLSDYRLAFVMPACDVLLDVSFVTLDTERSQESEGETQGALQTETNLTETEMQSTENQTGQPDLPEPETGREETLPEETETPMAETEGDGLPAQGSVVQMGMVTIPFDTWEFDPETDFRGMEEYDLELFDIDYISDGILYDVPGIYDSVYRVAKKGVDKFWFALRPVRVAEEGELTEIGTETETVTEAITESMTETFPEETEAATEAQTQPPMDVPESESELQETDSETVTEAATEGLKETETEASEETADPQVYINGGVNCTITLAEDSVLLPGEIVRYTVTPDEGCILQGTNVFQVEAPDQMEAFLTDNDMGLIVKEPVDYEMGEPDEDGTVEVSFFMPESCVLIEAAAEDPKADGAISLFTELGEDLGKVNFTTPYGGGTWYAYPDKFTKTGGLGTVVKTFTIYDKNGKVLKEGVYGFCLESSKDTAGPTTNAPFTELDQESEVLLAKALFYLSHGPGWGHDFTGTDGKVRNFTDIYNSYGLTSNQHRYSMTHLVLSKIYAGYQTDPNWSWNAGCTSDRMHSYSNILNADGIAFINDIINQLKKMGYPSCDLTPTTIPTNEIFQVNDRFVMPTIQYTSLSANYLTIPVDDKTWLVNESTGKTVHNGDALVKGGQSFHLEIDKSMEGKKVSYTATPKLYGSAGMYKVTIGQGSQDMAFSYSMEGLKFNITISKIPPYEEPKAYIEIQKQDQETGQAIPQTGGSFVGAEYTIYRNEACTDIAEVLTTDKKGYAKSSRLTPAIYYVKETKAPEGYYLDPTVYTVDARNGNGKEVFPVTSLEELIKKPIELQKYDKESGETGPNNSAVTLAGAEYTIYRDADCTDVIEVLTTDENGYAKSSDLTVGTYFIKETKAPEGYLPDETVTAVFVADDGKAYYQVTSKEQVIRGSLSIMKYLDDNTDSSHLQDLYDKGILAGITFTLTHEDPKMDPVVIVTDRYGYAATKDQALVYGTWKITESNTPEGYEGIEEETITIKEDGERLRYVIANNQPLLAIKLQKKDAKTGNLIPIKGAKFQILDGDGKPITMPDNLNYKVLTDTFTTDEDGEIKLTRGLPVGTYTIHEVAAPEGYLLAADQELVITKEMMDQETELVVACVDEPQLGKIRIQKVDQETQEHLQEGFGFEIKVARDITDAAGTIRKMEIDGVETELTAGTVVAYVKTDETGMAESPKLYLGTYLVTESEAANHYAVDESKREVTLSHDQEAVEVTYDLTVEDEKTRLEIYKVDSESSEEQDLPLSGITFRIFTAKDLEEAGLDPNGKLEAEQLSQLGTEYVTDLNGKILVTDLEHDMTYYVFEAETLPGYNLAQGLYRFHVDEQGLIDGKPLYSLKISNTANQVEISKKDITGDEELPGATLTVKDSEGTVVDQWVSTKEPHRIKGLPAGDYVLMEEKAPEGYAIAEAIHFTLTDSLEVQQVVMYDERLQVQVSKKDITNEEELPGAKLAITDSEGTIVDQWVSTDQPHVVNLTVGKYTLTEVAAPEKYATAASVEFEIKEDLSVTTVEMLDAPIQVEISKKDITNEDELPGAKLTVTDSDGNIVEEWISAAEPHKMNLAAGTYTLTETVAPEKYAKAESIVFTVADTAEIQKVTMYDQLIQVEISKKDITNEEELPGAKLTVTDPDGKIVEEWISTAEPHKMNLAAGTYTLTETAAPEKYAKAESIEFTVTDSMEVQKVTMYDQLIQVEISKKDITNEEELPGAKLTVKDSEGNLVEEWISTEKPHKMNLAAGTYTLTEVTAPKGYEVADSLEFTVTDSMEVQTVKMYDAPKEETVDLTGKTDKTTTTTGGGGMQPGNPVTNVIAQAVQTGDFNRYLPAVGAVAAGLITLLVLFFTRKKKENEKGSGRKK